MPIEVLDHANALEVIGKVFGFLYEHEPIAKMSNCFIHELPVLSPREFLELQCHEPRLLDRALFALSTGNFKFNKSNCLTKQSKLDHQKQYLAAVISSDILLCTQRKVPGHFQLMLGEEIAQQTVSNDFKNLSSAFGLAPSRNYTQKERAKIALEWMKKGLDVQPRDFVLLFFNNVGFKVLG